MTLETHIVGGVRQEIDPWVSTSRSRAVAAGYATDQGTNSTGIIAVIDLSRLTPNHYFIDVSTPALAALQLRNQFSRQIAVRDQEVGICGGVNPGAIVALELTPP